MIGRLSFSTDKYVRCFPLSHGGKSHALSSTLSTSPQRRSSRANKIPYICSSSTRPLLFCNFSLRPGGTLTALPTRSTRNTCIARSSQDLEDLSTSREPEDVRGAIAVGLELYQAEKYKEALTIFERGLELPGTGVKRYRDKPRMISEGEKQSVLYNIACCYSRLSDARLGLVALAGCLESGYEDAQQLRKDPDLEFLRGDPRFEGLIGRFKLTSRKGILGEFLKGFNL